MTRPLIALDGDGVLIDYHAGYRRAWLKAFGEVLHDVAPLRYHARERFGARHLSPVEVNHLHTVGFDADTWRGMPLLPGAAEACELLAASGARLVVVSALPGLFAEARHAGLAQQGVSVERVYAVGGPDSDGSNPKSAVLHELKPVAMVDDFMPFLENLPACTARILIEGTRAHSPNRGYSGPAPDFVFPGLLDFARAYVGRPRRYTGQ